MKKHLTMLTALFGAMLAWETVADTWTDPETGIEWTYTVIGETEAAVGSGSEYDSAVPWDTEGDIDIPAEFDGYRVTSINAWAFSSRSYITSVTIPEGVTNIGESAFSWCDRLTSVTIPEGVTNIGFAVFCDCGGLTNVTIPEGVTNIGESAFAYCSSLPKLTIPASVASIGNYAFRDCSVLTNATIPESVTSVGVGAFYGCSGLASVTIPEGVTSIGAGAFAYCSSLTNLTIPASVTQIGESMCMACDILKAIDVDSGNVRYASRDGVLFDISGKDLIQFPAGKSGAYAIPDGVTNICSSAFSYCSTLTSVTIPSSVDRIGNQAFANCGKLTEIAVAPENANYVSRDGYLLTKDGETLVQSANSTNAIPEGVTSIGDYAFSGCRTPSVLEMPEGVTNIGEYAFFSCKDLTRVTIPEGVTSIRAGAFSDNGLKHVTIPSSVTNIADFAFVYCRDLNIVFQGNAPETSSWAFSFGWGIESYTATAYGDTKGWGDEAAWNGLVLNRMVRNGVVAADGSVISIGGSAVSNEWLISEGVAQAGDSSETVAARMTEKGENGILRYQSYIFGMSPESEAPAEEQLKATFEGFDEDGVPIIGYAPTPNVPSLVSVTKFGAKQLGNDDDWRTLWGEGSERYYNFFKVQLTIQTQMW